MFLTRLYLNPQRRGAVKLLGSPQAMHAAVLNGFAPDQALTSNSGRILWRVDGAGTGTISLYVVSPEAPDFTALCEQAAWPTRPDWQSKPYGTLLSKLDSGQQWHFRLTANPTHRSRPTPDAKAKITGHSTVAHQEQWLLERAGGHGFRIVDQRGGAPGIAVSARGTRSFRRGNSQVTLTVATYEGVLEISDADRVRVALTAGIGRARGYGCGLITLARQ